jgi:hypothetical protein
MAATSTTDYWQNLRSQVTGALLDYARVKFIDVETRADDKHIRDTVDARLGETGTAGMSPVTVVLLVVGVVAGVVLLKRVL